MPFFFVCLYSSYLSLYPDTLQSWLLPRVRIGYVRPTLATSIVLIASYALMYTDDSLKPTLYEPVLTTLYPLLSTNYGHIRLLTQYFFYQFMHSWGRFNTHIHADSNNSSTVQAINTESQSMPLSANEHALYNTYVQIAKDP